MDRISVYFYNVIMRAATAWYCHCMLELCIALDIDFKLTTLLDEREL